MRGAASSRALRILILFLVFCGLVAWEAEAAKPRKKARPRRKSSAKVYRQYRQAYASAVVVEAETGRVLFEKSPLEPRAPASLTKMMTELIALESLERGIVSWGDTVEVPEAAAGVGGSRVRLIPRERLPLKDLLRAMAISSANDAAVAIASHIAGSEERFVTIMNQRARELGMSRTTFANSHGLDRPGRPGSITCARDLAVLARELVRHPQALEISSTVADTIRGGQAIHTTNRLLGACYGVDGLKTGYTGKAGYCLASTAERDGMRVISVLLGATSSGYRFRESAGLLAGAYERFRKIPVIRKGQYLGKECAIDSGSTPLVRLVAGEDVAVLLPAGVQPEITLEVRAPSMVVPPIEAGMPLGLLRVLVGDSLAVEVPAVAARAVRRANIFDRIGASLGLAD